jgi:putative DNA primase/helicase
VLDVLARFPDARRDGDGWAAKCPAHDDRKASLSIGRGDKQPWVLNCHAGCEPEAIVSAAGLTMADLLEPRANGNGSRQIVATYPYHDEHGTHLFNVVRFEPKDFRQQRADGVWSMKGVRRVL